MNDLQLINTKLVLVASILLLFAPIYSIHTDSIQPLNDRLITSEESSIPYLDNYLRKFSVTTFNYGDFYSLHLRLLAYDPDGIHSVILKYMLPNDTEYTDQIMLLNETVVGEYHTTIHFNTTANQTQYRVRYFANDTIGNEMLTEEFVYILCEGTPTVTGDTDAAVLDTPDLTYVVGTTDNVLRWRLAYGLPADDASYSLHKDHYLIELAPLQTSEVITNVDGLRIGSYLYEFHSQGYFGDGYDTAIVTVIENSTLSSSTTSTTIGSSTLSSSTTLDAGFLNLNTAILLGGVIAAVVVLCIVAILKKKRS